MEFRHLSEFCLRLSESRRVNESYDCNVIDWSGAAISLEWDKQPHYLEASLMMKGYSAEEAAAAARRATARPPPPATAFVSTRDKVRTYIVATHDLTGLTNVQENRVSYFQEGKRFELKSANLPHSSSSNSFGTFKSFPSTSCKR